MWSYWAAAPAALLVTRQRRDHERINLVCMEPIAVPVEAPGYLGLRPVSPWCRVVVAGRSILRKVLILLLTLVLRLSGFKAYVDPM